MPYCVWKHYKQSASSNSDSLLADSVNTRADAVEVAYDYLIANDNDANELDDLDLRQMIDDEGGFTTTDYHVVILSSADLGFSHDDHGVFEVKSPSSGDVGLRSVTFEAQ